MTPRDFPEFALLWQDLIDPAEVSNLHALARKIQRTAERRWLVDAAIGLIVIGMITLALISMPTSPATKFCFAAIMAFVLFEVWQRRRVAKAAQAMDAHYPSAFFTTAITNARADRKLSAFGLWGCGLGFCLPILMAVADGRLGSWDRVKSGFEGNIVFGIALLVVILTYGFAIPAHLGLRRQLRRLEKMRLEFTEEDVRDLTGDS